MGIPLRQLWKPIASAETVEGGVEAAKAVFELAKTLKEQGTKDPNIQQLLDKIPTLLEALNSPLGQVVSSSLPFVSLGTGLIKFALNIKEQEPTTTQAAAIVIQVAYLESIRKTLAMKSIFAQDENKASEEIKTQLRELGDVEIDDEAARIALVSFPKSELAQAFSTVLLSRLTETRIAESEVKTWVKIVEVNTARYIHSTLAESGKEVQKLRDWYSTDGNKEFEKYLSIDTYLEEQIKPLPEQKVFKEKFSFRDIYVPLKARHLDINGEEISNDHDFVLDGWVHETIIKPKKQDKVIFIQAGPGRGKTVFCRMLADWVKQNLHPLLTPLFIRLRDIETFEQSFEKTLSDALSNCDFVSDDPGWLTDRNTQYLFLLDGFDELRMEGRASGGIERFIQQVGRFQEKYKGKETGHRVILTGRPLALQGINYLPDNLERVKLLEMNGDLRKDWLDRWKRVIIVIPENPVKAQAETKKFENFLEAESCPEEIKNKLAKEPLLLYLLAKLHKEEEIKQEDFEQGSDSTQTKILIYQKSLDWVLKEQRDELLQYQIVGLNIDSLERILTEAGLCVVQSGGEYAKVKMIETRLARDGSDAAEIIQELRHKKGEKALTNALAAFYLRPAAGKMGGGVEFYHKSFGEFLCAKRLQESSEAWTTRVEIGRQQQWFISKEELARQIYDLLGYGGLTPEIVEYLMGLLFKSDKFRPVELFQRLLDFYWRWCDGEFIDAPPNNNYPQKTMLELREQIPARETYLGQRQVDVYTGLNIMILLLELHRYGQSQTKDIKQKLTFYPCGQPKDNNQPKDSTLLLRLIGYSNCIGTDGFLKIVGPFLREAKLSGVDLSHSYLPGIDLSGADLSESDLRQVYLSESNLGDANLSSTDLCRCDLTSSNLKDANLENAYLRGADCRETKFSKANLEKADFCRAYLLNSDFTDAKLSKASVKGAKLDGANFQCADFDNLIWDIGTQWFNARGLHKAHNIPQELEDYPDFQDAKELSVGLEKLESGQISEAIKICKEVANRVENRRGSTFKAHIYNKFAWLSCLSNKTDRYRNEIVELASQAFGIDPNSGNYNDTLAIALVLNPDRWDRYNEEFLDNQHEYKEHPYKKPIKHLEQALKSDDFHKLARPNMEKIRQRREDWIKQLKLRINPFTPKMLSILLQEEY